MGKALSFIIASLLSPNASAIIQNVTVSGASNFTVQNNQNIVNSQPNQNGTTNSTASQVQVNALYIYGGLGGTNAGCSGSGLCNSCDLSGTSGTCNNSASENQYPLCACNRSRITDSTLITIRTTQSTATGRVHIVGGTTASNGTTVTPGNGIGTDLPGSQNGMGSVTFTWAAACAALSGTATGSCEGQSLNGSLQLWIDNNVGTAYENLYNQSGAPNQDDNLAVTFQTMAPSVDEQTYNGTAAEGVGQFTAFPGDQRIYLTNVATATTFPALTDEASTASGMYIMASSTNLNMSYAGAADASGTTNVSGSGFGKMYVDGVKNRVGYYVRVAMLDQANNILQYYPNNNVPAGCDGSDPSTCQDFYVMPDPVFGILEKDFNCFVATAAYGTSLEPKIEVFRKFRDQILMNHTWGRQFVMDYYKYGPYAARFIVDKPVFRLAARTVLWPVWALSWIVLNYGALQAFAVLLAAVATFTALTLFARRRLTRA